ncbi:MAG: tripartite tricarboxylate transporter substrate binding protein [Betaproteobacteria bacterium]|nr:tripartite tricarboxylate transporter substrate binding protein [Betaproteobacteria bacterium]
MSMLSRRALTLAALSLAYLVQAAILPTAFAADPYPTKSVRIIVGFSPGGGTDLIARLIATKLSERLKTAFPVENRVGASGNIAGQQVAVAKPDGYTLLWVPIAHAVNAAIGKNLAYDPIGDFAPVTLVSSNPTLLNVHPSVPASNVRELIALAKAQPGKISFAGSGIGTSSHIAAELFRLLAGVDLLHIPYKGGSDATRAVVSGEAFLSFNDIQASIPLVRARYLKAIAITSRNRSKILPDVPTIAESGVPGYEYAVWFGLLAPKKTPPDIVNKLRNEIVGALNLPDVVQRFEAGGGEVVGNTPEEFGRFLNAEVEKWRKVMKAAGIQ